MVELVDTLDSGSSACKGMKVQVLSSALKNRRIRPAVFLYILRMEDFLDEIPVDELVGERVVLRSLDERDCNDLYAVIDRSRAFLSEHLPWPSDCRSADDVASRVESWQMQAQMGNGACWGIFEKAGDCLRVAGCIIVGWVQWAHRSATVSYWLGENFTGRGLATESLKLVSQKLFSIGINRIELSAAENNPKSAAVARRAGFSEEGISRDFERINGIFRNHIRFSRLAKDA